MEQMKKPSSGDEMKRSDSELALQEVVKKTTQLSKGEDSFSNHSHKDNQALSAAAAADLDSFFADVCSSDLSFAFKTLDMMNSLSSCGMSAWSQKRSSISSPLMDSQSSVCVGSPLSANKTESRENNKTRVTSSGSSDVEDVEIEAGPCEQSTNPIDLRRIRRMDSNRESARRSRKRKQAHLHDLESQVEQLTGENVTLFKQFSDATQQYRDADTNNRVLKSDVEALRAKVKLAEDMVTRGSLTCSLNPLRQNNLTTSPQPLNNNNNNLRRVPPTITINGDDANSLYAALDITNNVTLLSDAVSCVTDLWP